MDKISSKVLEKIKPTQEEISKVKKISNYLINKIKIKKTKIELGGSGAKDTWLTNAKDIDIYVKFDFNEYNSKDISLILEKELKRHFRVIKLHGSRDYFQISQEGFTVEIIPILDIRRVDDAKNITDISPFHVRYVKKHKKGDEIRLAKAFCKAQNCYGAESYIKGFSGYVLEILIIKYENFNKFIKNVSRWKDKEIIGEKKYVDRLNRSKKDSPLILIDPVDSNRNAAAALDKKNYNKLIRSSKLYLNNPSIKFFEKEEFNIDKIKKKYKNQNLIILEVDPLKGKEDVIGAKLLKCLNYISRRIELNDFKLIKYDWHWNQKALFWFVIYKNKLPLYKEHKGPPIENRAALENFKKKWKTIKIKNSYAYTIIKREFTNPNQFVHYLILNDKNINSLVKSVKFK